MAVAGPNGSGKSTLSAALAATLFSGAEIFDPDAPGVGNEDAPQSPIAAGRRVIEAVDRTLAERKPIVVETTLAGARGARLLALARDRGFRVGLYYICTASVESNIERVAARVARGGHDVPEADFRRRYARSLARLPEAIAAAHDFALVDNSGEVPRVLAHGVEGTVVNRTAELPRWAAGLPIFAVRP